MGDQLDELAERARDLHHADRDEQALELARRVLAADPAHPLALQLEYACLHWLGRYDDSLAATDRAAASGEPDWLWWEYRGRNLLMLRRAEEADAAFGELLRLRPEYATAHYLRSHISTSDAPGRMVDDIRRALALQPDDAEYLLRLAALQRGDDDLAGAEESLRRVIGLEPDHAGAMIALGEVLAQRGETIESMSPLLGAARTAPQEHADTVRDRLDGHFAGVLKAFAYSFPFLVFFGVWPFRIGMGGTTGRLIAGGVMALSVIPLGRWVVGVARRVPRRVVASYARRHPLLVSFSGTMLVVWVLTAWFVLIPGDASTDGLAPFAASLVVLMAWGVFAVLWWAWQGVRSVIERGRR